MKWGIILAKKSKIAKYRKQQMLVAKYAEIRKQLKVNHDYESLRKLPKDSNPIRLKNRDVHVHICVSLKCHVLILESWHIKEKYQVSTKQVGS